MLKPRLTYTRKERLKNKTVISNLFSNGQSYSLYPIRVVYTTNPDAKSDAPIQFALSVSKKKFKKAVDRNRVRRLIREAWRLEKETIIQTLPENAPPIALMIIFTGKEIPDFKTIKKSVGRIGSRGWVVGDA
ncbi:MAG: ribonuclease P protein component [Saprospiraceae bacterium]|nr:ribonuclease P protein component [Saprospiraceae bacterium]